MPEIYAKLTCMLDIGDSHSKKVCSTCYRSLSDRKEPPFCCGVNSPFNAIPKAVAKLTDFGASLVSLGMAFGMDP